MRRSFKRSLEEKVCNSMENLNQLIENIEKEVLLLEDRL
jgi:hypothetical protein